MSKLPLLLLILSLSANNAFAGGTFTAAYQITVEIPPHAVEPAAATDAADRNFQDLSSRRSQKTVNEIVRRKSQKIVLQTTIVQ